MNKTVFLTGANGFLGTQVALKLLRSYNYKIMVLVRGKNEQQAVNRLYRAWWEFPELLEEIGKRIHVLNGDITKTELGIEKQEYKNLVQTVTHVIHTAADWKLKSSLEELQKINVQGTKNVLKLAQLAHEDHGLERFSHVSTAYVAGGKKGIVPENSLTSKYGFLSDYEKTKFESEVLVKKSKFDVSIFRPSMIVGDSSTGYIKTFNTVYVPLRLYLSGKLKIIPVSRSMKINLVPVDYVADAVVKLTFDTGALNKTFHLTAPAESLPTLEELIEFVSKWGRENLSVKLSNPVYMPLNTSLLQKISAHGNLFGKGTAKLLETVDTLSPYFNENREYMRDNVEEIMGPYKYRWQDFLPKLLEFAAYYGFLHRSDRTVHEQVLFRLQRSSKPVKYYDIVEGEIKESISTDVYQKIICASKALQGMGINKGDRVAVTGYNSTKYLILDIAIGFIGAVSVPIYYTSPVNEIKEILDDSCVKILFAGTSQVLNDLKKLNTQISVVSLCNQGTNDNSQVISWEEFLKKGEKIAEVVNVPLNFGDTATIRYTSGTTGTPRGVMFNHGNIRWMAEFIASMPPWKDRTSEVSYLSFLPMNHVVEGIMGTYAPYYAPASLNLYFLEDFHDLEGSLQKVRPNVFFSVPRFYEKVWCSVKESRIGQVYLNSRGILKTVLGKLIRREVLKKAGLDRCAQLIVGSAPVSDELIGHYHEMGIEVYNAYGLTEAPLITINRIGKNRIGTVGEPLPDTHIKIGADGEILVNGPQVMLGYFKDDPSSLDEGWLHTGDLGYETPEGSLVITGRRKEVLVNSYGKTISPLKIEVMLKNISGIEEAMVFGDGKPYCSAFLWAETGLNLKEIDKTICEINTRLSRPEEVKKWVILKDDLSVGTELTANFKLKRKSISKLHKDVVDFIYGSGTEPGNVLHFGSMEVHS